MGLRSTNPIKHLADLDRRLMDKLNYNSRQDRLIHVGDLVAKGTKNDEVLTWMRKNRIQGVRGNHDQPVCRARSQLDVIPNRSRRNTLLTSWCRSSNGEHGWNGQVD